MEFDDNSPFMDAARLHKIYTEKAKEHQLQIPGLEDHIAASAVRESRVQTPDLERLYELASRTPESLSEAVETLNDIRDGIYRLLR